jgi:hypothetical protein
MVFAQRADARIELATWRNQASQFFATELGLAEDVHTEAPFPPTAETRVMIATRDGTTGTRRCEARPRVATDLELARAAEAQTRTAGLALLAERCPTVWLVHTETSDDRIALRIAAILASTLLGPIVAPDGTAIFGVKTARQRLERPPGS